MNELIKQFAEQATSYADTLDIADRKIYQEVRDREFAELILNEATKIAASFQYSDIQDRDVRHTILEHFEVE